VQRGRIDEQVFVLQMWTLDSNLFQKFLPIMKILIQRS